MKKILAIVLTVVLLLAFSVSSMALVSPGGTVYYEVIVNTNGDGDATVTEKVTVLEDGTVLVEPGESDTFEGWEFHKKDMSAAVEGVDYEIVAVLLSDGSVATEGEDYEIKDGKIIPKDGNVLSVDVKPLKDGLVISEVGTEGGNVPSGPSSPSDGYYFNMVIIAGFALLVIGGTVTAVAAKRVRG